MSKIVAIIVAAIIVAIVPAAIIVPLVVTTVVVYSAVQMSKKLSKSMAPELGTAAEFQVQGAQGIMVNKTGSNQSIPVIYGATRTGGIRVFAEANGTDNRYLHMAFVLSEGEINKCSAIYFDDVVAATSSTTGSSDPGNWTINSPWSGTDVDIYFRPGTDSQTEISGLAGVKSGWDPHFKGLAYVYVRFDYDEDVWKNGVPTITFDIEGMKVRDPNSLGTVAFSDNPAWCILDYLTNTRYGKGIADADLDLTTFEAAGEYCYPDGGAKRFEMRGNVSTHGTIYANLIDMLTTCRGYIAFGNKYRLLVDKASSETPFEITKANSMGSIDYVLGDKSSMFNKMTAKYLNASTEYKDDILVVENSTLKTQDNELDLEAEIPLPFTKTTSIVQQILIEEINQSRQSHMINIKCTVDAIDLQVGDLVNLTNETFGITQKTFRVMSTIVEPSSEVKLALREYDADVYGGSIIEDARADDND